MQKQRNPRSAFTLIEMLVVIAIIALLAAILVPTVTSALENANQTQALTKGRGIYQAIFAAHLESINFPPEKSFWPEGRRLTELSPRSSTQYFRELIQEEVLGQDFGLFSSSGVPAAINLNSFDADRNMWSVVERVNNGSPSQTPFLVSRNLNESTLPVPPATPTTAEADRLQNVGSPNGFENPFRDRAIVVVRIGGGADRLSGGRVMTRTNLNPGRFGDGMTPAVGILQP